MCLFVPFLHKATPKPAKVPKTEFLTPEQINYMPLNADVKNFLQLRDRILRA